MISSNVQWQALTGPGALVPLPSAFGFQDTPSINRNRLIYTQKFYYIEARYKIKTQFWIK